MSSVVPSGDHRGALVLRGGTLIKSLRDKKNKFCDCFSYFKVVLNTWNIFFWSEESDLHKMYGKIYGKGDRELVATWKEGLSWVRSHTRGLLQHGC